MLQLPDSALLPGGHRQAAVPGWIVRRTITTFCRQPSLHSSKQRLLLNGT